MFFIVGEAIENVLDFSKEIFKVLDFISFLFNINIRLLNITLNIKLSNSQHK